TSNLVEKRRAGLTLSPEAPVARAIHTSLPVVTEGGEDVFGPGVPERRRRERAGTAYPLLDGHLVVGALVLIGPPLDPDAPVADQLGGLMSELGPRLAAARALHEAERRGLLDPLTGLCNRREFERVLERYAAEVKTKLEPATLVYSDLDRFKGLNDTLGHAAGDAARRTPRCTGRSRRDATELKKPPRPASLPREGATGFDGYDEDVAACPGLGSW